MDTVVIFGGAGFIGQHFAQYLLNYNLVGKVIIVDIASLEQRIKLDAYIDSGQILLIQGDVRQAIDISVNGSVDLICNFAAVHREPGHKLDEYYDTNLPGAKNVCDWASKVGCDKIIFTSSIAPYGPTEEPKTENDTPTPVSGYGGSKLAAEKMHEVWQASKAGQRRLVIVRPGVVFGSGERGNVSRLIKAILHRYFFYMGNRQTRKAGTYVKELCNAIWWVMHLDRRPVEVFNMSMNPGPTMQDYVDVVCKTASVQRAVFNVPFWLLYPISHIVDPLSKLLKINQPISPVRLKKLVKSNNIIPARLEELEYEYKYSFEEAMKDWMHESPEEWS